MGSLYGSWHAPSPCPEEEMHRPNSLWPSVLVGALAAATSGPLHAEPVEFQLRGLIDLSEFGGSAAAPFDVTYGFMSDAPPTSFGVLGLGTESAFYPVTSISVTFDGVSLSSSGSAFNPDVIGLLNNLDGFEGPLGADEYLITASVSGTLAGFELGPDSYFQAVIGDFSGAMLNSDRTLPTQVDFATSADNGYGVVVGLASSGGGFALAEAVPGSVTLARINGESDYNADGVVDAADYTVWRDAASLGGALTNDPTPGVGADDYSRFVSSFGRDWTVPAPITPPAASPAPEPTSAALAIALAATSLPFTRRGHAPRPCRPALPRRPTGCAG